MYDRVRELLEKSGLNESEAKMFQKLLNSSGAVPLKDVIAECGMTEFTGYRSARRLAERGFVTLEKKGSLKFIFAEPVERIARKVGKEQRKLRRLELQLLDIAKSKQSLAENTQTGVEVRSGKEAFLEAYDSLPERRAGELLGFGSLGSVWCVTEADYFSSYEQDWIRRRIRRGMKAVLMEADDSIFRDIMQKAKREMRDVKLLSDATDRGSWTAVTGTEAFVFEADPFAPTVVAVKDSKLVNILKHYHQLLWKQARITG